jgi:hypothetical protein
MGYKYVDLELDRPPAGIRTHHTPALAMARFTAEETTDFLSRDGLLADCRWAEDGVAVRLLGTQWHPTIGWWAVGADQDPSFSRHDLGACRVASAARASGAFARCDVYEFPDAAPGGGGATAVRRYAARDAEALCAPLRARAASLADGRAVSNVGGTRGDEEAWDDAGASAGAWYGGLLPAVGEAVADAVVAGGGPRPFALEGITGWLNASGAGDANALHDHGTAAFACVFFATGGGAADPARRDAGSLLLRTQARRFAHAYGYAAIAPEAGDLWLFPGYVPHCVMPRALKGEAGPAEIRISAACNVAAR